MRERTRRGRRRVYASIWAGLAWFTLLRASLVQWSVPADGIAHIVRVAGAYAVVVPVVAYAVLLLGKRLRFVYAVAVLNLHVVAVAWLHGGGSTVPLVPDVAWAFVGVALGALLAAALESTLAR